MKQEFLGKFALAAVLSTMATASFAGGSYTGLFRPYFYSDNLYIEEVSVQKAGVPACVGTRNLLKLAPDQNGAGRPGQRNLLARDRRDHSSSLADLIPGLVADTHACWPRSAAKVLVNDRLRQS